MISPVSSCAVFILPALYQRRLQADVTELKLSRTKKFPCNAQTGVTQYRIAYWTPLLDHCSVCEISSNNVRQINWILLCLTTSRMSFICTRTNAAVRPRNIQFFVLLSRSMSVDSYIYSPFYLSDGCLLWPFLVFCGHTDQRARQDHNIEMESLAYIWSVGAVLPNNNLLLHICRITDALVSCNKTIID